MKTTAIATVACALAWVCASGALGGAARADTIHKARVVHIEANEIYFDLGRGQGLGAGDRLRIKRPIKLKHPVSRKVVSDWLPVGSGTVTAVGDKLSMAVLEADLLSQVAVGDIIEVLVETAEPIAPPPPPPPEPEPEPEPTQPLPQLDRETQNVLAVWNVTAGKSIEVRIGAWEDYLASNPDSRFAAAITEDLEQLRSFQSKLEPAQPTLDQRAIGGLMHSAPTRGPAGEAIPLTFLIQRPADLAAAWLHYRPTGAASYSKGILRREGDYYLRGEIPGVAVRGGGVEYFVEIATIHGVVGTAVGTPEQPIAVEVELPPLTREFTDTQRRSRVTLTTTYLDFATFDDRGGDRTDAFVWFEADFLYRLRGSLYGIRTGLGVLGGSGGFADEIYSSANPAPKAGFNYGYVELELRGPRQTGVRGRVVAGVGRDGFGLGAEGRFRLGAEDGTNLSVGLSSISQIGFLTELRMQWEAVTKFPLGLAVALTDQPNQGDLGVRLTTDIGYRALSWVQPTLRISYQARTVDHSGIGGGLGLVFDW